MIRILERYGHSCSEAENGLEAIEAFHDNERDVTAGGGKRIDTILMDYEMPVMNGPNATETLREAGCKALILGLTGSVYDEYVAFIKAKGADEVLLKTAAVSRS